MKKWIILLLVCLGGTTLILQYVITKKDNAVREKSAQLTDSAGQLGVPLPQGTTSYAAPTVNTSADFVEYMGQGDYDSLLLPVINTTYKGACEGGTMREILSTHGKYWGYFAKEMPFDPKETKEMYGLIGSYVGCMGLSRDRLELCGQLPGEAKKGKVTVDSKQSLSRICNRKMTPVLVAAYMAGKVKGDDYCHAAMAGFPKERLAKIPFKDFCDAMSKGPAPTMELLVKYFPKKKDKLAVYFPVKESDCGGKPECLKNFRLYNALKYNRVSDCPDNDFGLCKAYIEKNAAVCDNVVVSLSKTYCAAVARVKKATGGYIGITKEEVKEMMDKQTVERDEMVKRKQEYQHKQTEIALTAKKKLGKAAQPDAEK